MAKLTSIEKDLFKMNREVMLAENINWAFCRETGVTGIYKAMPENNFVKLSVAYCNKNDKFKKKTGLNIAFRRWENDMAIQIPNIGWEGGHAEHTIELFVELITRGNQILKWVD